MSSFEQRPYKLQNPYRWQTVLLDRVKFVATAKDLFTSDEVAVFTSHEFEAADRVGHDGSVTLIGKVGNQEVALIHNDFRVNGASFGRDVSRKIKAFLQYITEREIPLVFTLSTLGVRMMDGRSVFGDAFSLVAAMAIHAKKAPVFTISTGKTLGIGAIFFRLGHYRAAIIEQSQVNLTGPEVIKKFFGENFDFQAFAGVEGQFQRSSLINEVVVSLPDAFMRIQAILKIKQGNLGSPMGAAAATRESMGEQPDHAVLHMLNGAEMKLKSNLKNFDGPALEVFSQLNPVVRTFLAIHKGTPCGVFINPPGHPNNLISASTLRHYSEALDFFSALRVPIISFLDTPGVDPRAVTSEDSDVVSALVQTADRIISYPYPKMGFINGRAYGGATILGFPKIFGAVATYAIEGSHFGVMHPSIIESLLSGSPRLLEQWQKSAALETVDGADLIQAGIIDAMLPETGIRAILDKFVSQCRKRPPLVQAVGDHYDSDKVLNRLYDL